jgi:TolB protein
MSCFDAALANSRRIRLGTLLLAASLGAVAAGAEPERLTRDGTLKLSPVFRSREEIVFATHEKPNLVSIVALSLRDGSRRRVHPGRSSHQFDPSFSHDGRFHAFALSANAPQMVLVIEDTKEKRESVFRPREARATARNPTIAPYGSRIAFSLSDIGGHQIASVDSQGKSLKSLTQAAGMNAWPAYSPDGRRIAFGSSRNGDFEIYVMSADGSDLKRLTHSPGLDARPAWSPDGSRLAFVSNRDGNYEIYVMDSDGSRPCNVTKHVARDDHPAWHPDGRRILFVSDRHGGSDLYLSDAP